MKIFKTILLLFLYLVCYQNSFADHIFGGNISLTQLDKATGKFKVTLNVYTDIGGGNSSYINFMRTEKMILRIFSKTTNDIKLEIPMDYERMDELVYDNEICAKLMNLRTGNFIYTKEIVLNPDDYIEAGGYYIALSRCCRNNGIVNIVNSGESGSTFYAEFPSLNQNGKKITYSSPQFELPNGDYICIRKPFTMTFGAINPVATDELRYSIVTPYSSENTPFSVTKTVEAKPYPLIKWNSGYSTNESIMGNPSLTIDSKTGFIQVTANQLGLYVFTIQCEQLRDGKLIGLVRQDFQLPVVDCLPDTPPYSEILINGNPSLETGICPGDMVSLAITSTPGNFNYQWQKDGINIIGANQTTFQANSLGRYTAIKSFKSFCASDINTNTIIVKQKNVVKIIPSVTQICEGDSISLDATPLHNDVNFSWAYNNKTIANKANFFAKNIGFYSVTGSVSNLNCSSKDSIEVTRKPGPILTISNKNIFLQLGNSKQLEVRSSNAQSNFQWFPDKWLDYPLTANPVTNPQDDIIYYIVATTPEMCTVKDSLTITLISKLYIPNAFSPNNDGVNDKWEILGINQFSNNEVYIYNRWGELIFYSNGYNTAWDGTYKGEVVSTGDYVYEIRNSSMIKNFSYRGHLSVFY